MRCTAEDLVNQRTVADISKQMQLGPELGVDTLFRHRENLAYPFWLYISGWWTKETSL